MYDKKRDYSINTLTKNVYIRKKYTLPLSLGVADEKR